MKKKIISVVLIMTMMVIAVVVGIILGTKENDKESNISKEANSTGTEENIIEKVFKKYTAEEIINLMKEEYNLPIENIIVYTEENDINSLLGRPHQYTSKVNFADSRIEQYDDESPKGGSIEVFENKEDMQKRKEYVESVTSTMSMLVEYDYDNEYALLRLSKELTPTQVEEYKKAFDSIID